MRDTYAKLVQHKTNIQALKLFYDGLEGYTAIAEALTWALSLASLACLEVERRIGLIPPETPNPEAEQKLLAQG